MSALPVTALTNRSRLTDLISLSWLPLLLAVAFCGLLWLSIQARNSTWMSDTVTKRLDLLWCLTLLGTFIAGVFVGGCISFFLAYLVTNSYSYDKYKAERDAIAPVIANDPAFKHIEITEDQEPRGGAHISGYVPTAADKKRLKELVIRALGERHSEYLMKPVRVRDEQK
jgi:hypothetical protein